MKSRALERAFSSKVSAEVFAALSERGEQTASPEEKGESDE